jgi:hypothetical protein
VARVLLPDSFSAVTGDVRELVSRALTYRELTTELQNRWPQLTELIARSAVAIDGQIYQDAFLEPLKNDSEVVFMARIEGG